MAWSGGTFTRLDGATHWVDDKNAAINIVASRHDTNDNDFATGINFCLTRDNQAKPTASFLPNADNSIDLGALATRWRTVFGVTIAAGAGSVGVPAISFGADPDTGLSNPVANNLALSAGGTAFAIGTSTALVLQTAIQMQTDLGSAGTPAYSFSADPDTGMYRAASANTLAFSSGTVATLALTTTAVVPQLPIQGQDASAGTPAFSFGADPDTGFYRDTANQIGIGLAGVTAGQIAQGTFTGTLTGMSAGTTGTVNYQRIGKLVKLWITATITGTSNATTMTMTGLPAIVQPASAVSVLSAGGRADTTTGASTTEVAMWAQINAGTITFNLLLQFGAALGYQQSANNFANTGIKGLQAGWSVTYVIS